MTFACHPSAENENPYGVVFDFLRRDLGRLVCIVRQPRFACEELRCRGGTTVLDGDHLATGGDALATV